MKKMKGLLLLSAIGFMACEKESVELGESSLLDVNTIIVSDVVTEEAESVLDDIVMYSESAFGVDGSTSKSSTSKEEDEKRGRSEFFKACADIVSEEFWNFGSIFRKYL